MKWKPKVGEMYYFPIELAEKMLAVARERVKNVE